MKGTVIMSWREVGRPGSLLVLVLLTCLYLSVDARPRPRGKRAASGPNVDPDKFLERFGYLQSPPPGVQHDPHARNAAIGTFQKKTGLRVTGRMNEETLKKMAAPRCGVADIVHRDRRILEGIMLKPRDGSNNVTRPEDYYAPGYKWNKQELTWRATNYSPDMSEGSQRRAFADAFSLWRDVTPMEFRETSHGTPDIEILFGYGHHGDGPGNEFDNKGGILAHAFYPTDGDTHFDEAEDWTEYTTQGTNLMTVAAHEFGHALGLGHSDHPEALMAPYYTGYSPNLKLKQDDITAIQSLYGQRDIPVTPRPGPPDSGSTDSPATQSPGGQPASCDTKFDAILQAHDGYVYAFKYKWLWRIDTYSGLDDGFPTPAREVYDRPPLNIAAAVYSWMTSYTYFFKGQRVYRYYRFDRKDVTYMTNPTWPSVIDSALMGRDGRIYLLSGSVYHVFDEFEMDLSQSAPSRPIVAQWPGVPNDIEAAVRLSSGYTYFFKGNKYRKFDEYYRWVEPGYPRDIGTDWMGPVCGGSAGPK